MMEILIAGLNHIIRLYYATIDRITDMKNN